ncbi:hypothetical protein CCR75_007399 [Bremia lactucae]|uniref:Uncharacterized protein n=1 Tax=Bremia lactucae TaxID=4779 RepID=A0A976IK37_BRELC|nr:hypothetical protein CCR75_007399 [Bremia lactucae]
MSKREYFLRKGLQMQRLDEQISSAPISGNASRELTIQPETFSQVTKYRDLCPPATPDNHIQKVIAQCKGDTQRMETAISELWENYRGSEQDAWATVSKKATKKKNEHPLHFSQRSNSKPQHQNEHVELPQNGDLQSSKLSERYSTRGRGSLRGRGLVSLRGGRGGRGGRSRGGAVIATDSTREPLTGDESPENDTESITNSTNEMQLSRTVKDTKRDRGANTTTKAANARAASQIPPVVHPVLTGAWTKKLNVNSVSAKPEPTKHIPSSASSPTPASPKPADRTTVSVTDRDAAVDAIAQETLDAVGPLKKEKLAKESKKTQKRSNYDASEPFAAMNKPVDAVEKVASPKNSPQKMGEKQTTTKRIESTGEATPSANIATGWGNLDVAASSMSDWSSSVPAASCEAKMVPTSNAWTRNNPILSSPATKINTSTPSSPVADTRLIVSPDSPKDTEGPRSSKSASTSPRPYLKMGKWDRAATPNLSLQFGSFSLNGMESLEPATPVAAPVSWSSSNVTTSGSKNVVKQVTKTTTAQTTPVQSGWGTATKTVSPKSILSPDHSEQQQQTITSKSASSAPPGLSVDSGRVTPTTGHSPRFAPSAPSPASLPKPDEVKRGTPSRAQGGSFQTQLQEGAATQNNKLNIGYGTGLYQASYGQYSMDLGRSTAASAPGQHHAGSGTPKTASTRGSAVGQVAIQSPSLGKQAVSQMQQIPLQQQVQQQQQQQQAQEQSHQKQIHHQQSQQGQQNPTQQQTAAQLHQQAQASMQQSYHYAPPPPPGMALPYNPYNYNGYYQGYGYYQNPQFAQYSPRTQYPPRGSMPYGIEGPVPGFSNSPNMPYQDQHIMAQQHEYAGAVPQGFGEINAAYMQQTPMQQQSSHLGPQGHGKGGSGSVTGGPMSQQSQGQRGNASMQNYQNGGGREHVIPPVPNASAAMTGSYNQHYGWAGNYGAQPVGGWGHMVPQGYQQSPSHQQQHTSQQQQQQQPNTHQQSYHQYGNGIVQAGNNSSDLGQTRWSSS